MHSVQASAATAVAIDLAADTVGVQFQGLYVGVAGNIVVDTLGGSKSVTFANVPVGFFPVACSKVYSSANGTTASSLVGLAW